MAVIRVRLLGDGTPDNLYRVPLPTYEMLLADHADKTALVNVPNADFHDDPKKIDPNGHTTSVGHHILTLDEAGHRAWYEHLDKRYEEHNGEFRPEIA